VNVPLDGFFPWSSGKLNVQTAEESLEKLKMNLEQTRTQTTLTVKNSYNSILQNITQLELLEKSEELTQKAYEMSKNAYNMGSTDLLSLQQAEDNLYSARYSVQNQKYTILTSILTLEDTLGLPFGTLGK
jgi:outer membrane protein TolC